MALAYAYHSQLNFQMRDEDSAVVDYTKALELDPDHVRVYKTCALTTQKQGNLQLVSDDLKEYLRLAQEASDYSGVAQQIANLEELLQAES